MSGALSKNVMSGDITVMDYEEAGAIIAEEMTNIGSGSQQGVTYVNFSGKLGRYNVGKNKEDMDPDRLFFMDFRLAIKGWNCWKGSKPIDKHRWRAIDRSKAVHEHELEDHSPYNDKKGEGWRPMAGFWAKALDGDETTYEFTTDSTSGRNSVEDLFVATIDRLKKKEPFFPVFAFECEEFTAQDSTNWKPVFTVAGWLTEDQIAAVLADVGYSVENALAGKQPTKAQLKKMGS